MTKLNKSVPKKQTSKTVDIKQLAAAVADMLRMQKNIIEGHNNLAKFTNDNLESLKAKLEEVENVVIAVCKEIGPEKVAVQFEKLKVETDTKISKKNDEDLMKALETGILEKADTISEGSLVVYSLVDAEGNVKEPSRFYSRYGSFVPEVQGLITGKLVGDKVPMQQGHTLLVLEVYKDVPKPEPETTTQA